MRRIEHPELFDLAIAHLDCDSFYATVEKRDDPSLRDRPVIVGGGRRGVVAAACYIARLSGVRSAMPMFKALDACPDAVVIKPDMRKYAVAGRAVRSLMQEVSPLVEPISIDEAFIDLESCVDTEVPPAAALTALALRVEREVGVTLSVGLSYNKFLAKVASDLDKPRGFAVIGRKDAEAFLTDRPVSLIWGVGAALDRKLGGAGIRTIGQLRGYDEETLVRRYGKMGRRLYRFARGEDHRRVAPEFDTKSVSTETTFSSDIADPDQLRSKLIPLCGKVAERLQAKNFLGRTLTLKMKTSTFRILTRSTTLPMGVDDVDTITSGALDLLAQVSDGTEYRLIGIGVSQLEDRAQVERAVDLVTNADAAEASDPVPEVKPPPPLRFRKRLL